MNRSATYALALSVFLLAAALFYVGSSLPALNDNLTRAAATGDVISEHVPDMVALANRYEPHIGPLLEEVAASRALADRALLESAAYREQLPELLARLTALEARMAALQEQLPDVLERIDAGLAESRAWRPLAQSGLEEASQWRDNIPGYLSRSERLVAGARKAGENASAGVITGIFTGALSLPFTALGNVKNFVDPRSLSAKNMTDEDWQNLRNAAILLLAEPQQVVAEWRTEASGNEGTVQITATEKKADGICHTLMLTNRFSRDRKDVTERLVCSDAEGVWKLVR